MADDGKREQFELERFEWKAPDRLELAGKFHDLGENQLDEPVLVVSGADGARRLRAAGDPSEDDGSWRAQFVWDDPPVGVDAATLELGPDVAIDLPAPGAKETLLRPVFLDVRRASTLPAAGADVALQAELVAAEQQVQELRAARERDEAELARARADVETERQGRAADAERFRDGLARVRASAEQALAAARRDVERLEAQLTEAREQSDAATADLGAQLEAAEAARAQAESERDALRAEVAATEELKSRIGALEQATGEAGEMRADAERLLERLTKLADVLDAGK